MLKRGYFFIILIISAELSQAQHKITSEVYPEVGKPMPAVYFSEVVNYPKKELALSDLKGKWKVIYCWNAYCGSCINSFPKWNKLKAAYPDKVVFMLLGYTGARLSLRNGSTYKKVKSIYTHAIQRTGLTVIGIFDSIMLNKFNHVSPHTLIIDPDNIVRAVTDETIYADRIDAFIKGENPRLEKAFRDKESKINIGQPFLIDNNGSYATDFLYRSVLTQWKESIRPNQFQLTDTSLQVTGARLDELYRIAITGKIYADPADSLYGDSYFNPILEMQDTSAFASDGFTNRYCYSLFIPTAKAGKEHVLSGMRADLEKFFGYEIRMEKRVMPYWKLVKKKASSIKIVKEYDIGNTIRVLGLLQHLFDHDSLKLNYVNETGLLLDDIIYFPGFYSMITTRELIPAMNAMGLFLEKAEKQMKVLVIRDKSTSASR
jgi:thiol-disulfide isomerase/thioredoxin